MTYAFRVAFRLTAEGTLQSSEQFLEFVSKIGTTPLKFSSGTKDVPIGANDRFSVSGGGFESTEAASTAANAVRQALLLFAAQTRIGLDLGQNSLRSFSMSAYGRELMEKQLGAAAVLEDHLGTTVFQAVPKPSFVRVNINAKVARSAQALVDSLASSVGRVSFVSSKAEVAAGLYALSHFAGRAPARFLLLFIALESLFSPVRRSNQIQLHIDELLEKTNQSSLPQEDKDSLLSALSFQRNDSIAATGRKLAATVLAGELYDSLVPEEFFAKIYKVRNNLVHRGKIEPEAMHVLVGEVDRFVANIVSRHVVRHEP